jgi:D-glycerate 3-kinase
MTENLSSSLQSVLQQQIQERHLPSDFMSAVSLSYMPVAQEIRRLRSHKEGPLLVSFNGAQGSGKSTITAFLRLILIHEFKLETVEISIDDFYHTRHDRQRLAQEVHPLLLTRGVPGTHDIELASETLACLTHCSSTNECALPRFNKAIDDRADPGLWPVQKKAVDIILFEGWCNHAPVLSDEALINPVNELEAKEDQQAVWRTHMNDQLKIYHERLFKQADMLIYLQIPSFEKVFEWRGLQEKKLAQTSGNKNNAVMDDNQLRRFIQHYERITRSCLEELPAIADIVLKLGASHNIESTVIRAVEKADA